MKRFSLKYKLLVLTVVTLFITALAADIPFVFKAGDVISADQMNQNFAALNNSKQELITGTCAAGSAIRSVGADGKVECEVDDIGSGAGNAGVDAINGMTGAVTLQAGDNITIDDSQAGQIRISAASGGTNTNNHNHFGQTWTGTVEPNKSGLSIVSTNAAETGLYVQTGPGEDIRNDIGGAILGFSESNLGVVGVSTSGDGVYGTSSSGDGVSGFSSSGEGVSGFSSSSNGVVGRSQSSGSAGVYGFNADGAGVQGESSSNRGVFGRSQSGAGVYGESDGIGVWGKSTTRGVVGTQGSTSCAGTYGVGGCATSGDGVYGVTSLAGSSGIRGRADGTTIASGVYGSSTAGFGVQGESTDSVGVYGKSTNGNAAFFTGGSGGTGICRYNGGADWICTSDRNAKENFQPVDSLKVLNAVATLPISTWNMKGDTSQTPHMGPVAQDFYSVFGLGEGDTTINRADVQGVTLAAVQGLYQLVQEQQVHIEAQQAQLEELQKMLTQQ